MPFKMKYDKSSFPFKSAVKETEKNDNTKKEKEVVQPMVIKSDKPDSFGVKTGKFIGNMLLGGAENDGLIGKVSRFTLKTGDKDKLEEEVMNSVNENPADQVIGNRFALSPRTKAIKNLFNANLKNQGKDFKLKI